MLHMLTYIHIRIQCLFSGENVAVFVSRLIKLSMTLHSKFQLLSTLKGVSNLQHLLMLSQLYIALGM